MHKRLPILLIVVVLGAGAFWGIKKISTPIIDKKINFYQQKVKDNPSAYSVYAQLAGAYFEKSKAGFDPFYLNKAKQTIAKSLEVYPYGYLANKYGAQIYNYSHEFKRSMKYIEAAQTLFPNDPTLVVIKMEALIGLDDREAASQYAATLKPDNYQNVVALAQWHIAQKELEAAIEMLIKARQYAIDSRNQALAHWLRVRMAGVYLDEGFLEKAKLYLDQAEEELMNSNLMIHLAEYHELKHDFEAALTLYQKASLTDKAPFVHARIARVAKKLGKTSLSEKHFKTAETAYLNVLNAGQIYTLESLAELYMDQDLYPEKAYQYAEENLKYKRDNHAQTIFKRAQAQVTQSSLGH